MLAYLWIALGGALGSVGRFWLGGVAAKQWGTAFPWGTLLINVSGSFLIGFLATLSGPEGRPLLTSGGRQFFLVGVCGGYTTFSAFSLETLHLMQQRQWLPAAGYALLSVSLCLLAVWVGHVVAANLSGNAR